MSEILPLLVPIIAMMIPIVAIIMGTMSKVHRDQQLHETVRQLTLQGKAVPPELLKREQVSERKVGLEWTPKFQLRAAVVNIGVGVGLGACLFIMAPHDWFWSIGLVPLAIGLALLALWRIESKQSVR